MKKEQEKNKSEKKPRLNSPLDYFFKLGDLITKDDPKRQVDFTYGMLWILFLAFAGMFMANIYRVLRGDIYSLIWVAVGFAIASLQFFNLRNMHEMRKIRANPQPEEKIESVKEMLKGFKDMKGGKSK